ncbi:hypothetical protein DM02DRAFT_648481 [Periconia macrospinosa]|uniref:RRM domain-containing protein n=1 Tax=Periconia macrospinosa TaxID=97972 RepID=A0A2V1EDZ4_9PLEO|nr:hypothetical protein DM02DRAFT_648481 [Periconia macrospinosa]
MGSSLFLRGSTRICPVAIAAPHRQFTSASGSLRNAISNTEGKYRQTVPKGLDGRKLLASGIHRRATPHQIESLFKDAGVDVTSITMAVNRFTFGPSTFAIIEVSNEQQASRAVEELNTKKVAINSKPFQVAPLLSDWEIKDREFSPTFLFESANPDFSKAMKPVLENRRVVFKVKLPGWAPLKQKVSQRNRQNLDHVVRLLSKYGLEAVSDVGTNWGRISFLPKYLCLVDFSTKEGAEEAIRELHNTEHEGQKIGLELSKISPWKAHLINQWDPKLLIQLKESGLAPAKIFPNKIDAKKSED